MPLLLVFFVDLFAGFLRGLDALFAALAALFGLALDLGAEQLDQRLLRAVALAHGAELDDAGESLWLRGLVGRPDGSLLLRAEARAAVADAEQLGVDVAEDLLAQGAGDILAEVYGS